MDQETLLRLMLTQATDHALILLDANGRVLAWLMGAERLFGHDAAEMAGATIERLFTPEDRERRVPSSELEIAAKIGACEDDRWMLRKNGLRFWANGMVNCLRNEDGSIAGYSKVLRDRTDTRGQIETLRSRAEALAQDHRRRTAALGMLAHDMRNPLAVLANVTPLMDMGHPRDAKLAHLAQIIRRQTEFLDRLVENLLDLVRVRTERTALQSRPTNLKEIVEQAVETAGTSIAQNGQRVELALPGAPIILQADPVRLKQVFVNLLSNASKFSAPGAGIAIEGLVEDDEAVVRIKDQGRGITADLLPHVFDLFTQGEGQEGAAGLGLGLAIVKEYVEAHGGTVQVRSDGAGRGTEFFVRLPLAERPPRDG